MVLGWRNSLLYHLHLTISSQKYLVENLAYDYLLRYQVLFSTGIQMHNFNISLKSCLLNFDICSKSGVSKLRPAGQIRPVKPFHLAREAILSMKK